MGAMVFFMVGEIKAPKGRSSKWQARPVSDGVCPEAPAGVESPP